MLVSRTPLPKTIGKYEIIEMIGRGGMGVVYKARDPFIDRIVAVKTISVAGLDDGGSEDDHAGRLRMEARSAGKLQHPNIVTIYDFGEEREHEMSYIVMEFVEGVNLSRVMHQHRPLPLATRLNVLTQVARGLAYAHEAGVVHRDMKPSNICVTIRGTAKILDFGLARFDSTKLTKTGFLSGTIAYMSPERFRGDTGPSDDIFAFGAVAYEFLAYQRAFPGETTPEVVSKILGGILPPPISAVTNYPQALDEVIMRGLQMNAGDRYQSAAEFERALVEFSESAILRRFAIDEAASPEHQEPIRWTDSGSRSSLNPYSSGGRSMSAVAPGDAPTINAPKHDEPKTEVGPRGSDATVLTTKPSPTRTTEQPTLVKTKPAGVADAPPTIITQTASIAPEPPDASMNPTIITAQTFAAPPAPKRGRIGIIAAVVVVAAIIGVVALIRRDERVQPTAPTGTVTTTQAPAPKDDGSASRESEIQIATASTLANLVARRELSPDERVRFTEASSRLDMAKKKIESRDFTTSTALAAQASATFRDLLSSTGGVPPQTATVAPRPERTKPAARPTPVPKEKPPQVAVAAPPPPVVTTTTAAPAPQPQPAPVVPKQETPPPVVEPVKTEPSRADLEREIRAFVREMAAAYQDKDVAFFRRRARNYNDQMGRAITNSPSVKVEMTVSSIQFAEDGSATVAIRRVDTFAEAGAPPGVQNLAYELRRTADGWQILSVSRR